MLCKCLVKNRDSTTTNDTWKPRKDRPKHYRSRAKAIKVKDLIFRKILMSVYDQETV